MNQDHGWRINRASFLIMHADAVDVCETRTVGVEHSLPVLSQSTSRGRSNSLAVTNAEQTPRCRQSSIVSS